MPDKTTPTGPDSAETPSATSWTEGLAPAEAELARAQRWTGPADVVRAYQARAVATDPWSGLEPEIRAVVEAKQWKGASDAARAYAAAQKLLGKPADELAYIPKAGLTDEMKRDLVRRVLGTPETPDAYDFGELKDQEGGPQMISWWRGLAHKLGLGQAEAAGIASEWAALGQQETAGAETRSAALRETAAAALKAKHGAEFESLRASGARALAALGIAGEGESSELELLLEQAMGPEAFFETFSALGKKLGEYKVREGGAASDGPSALGAEMAGIKSDPRGAYWVKDHPGHKAAVERVDAIMRKLHGELPAFGPGSE